MSEPKVVNLPTHPNAETFAEREVLKLIGMILPEIPSGEHLLFGTATAAKGHPGYPIGLDEFKTVMQRGTKKTAAYISTALHRLNDDGRLLHTHHLFKQLNVIILDDIGSAPGSKASIESLPELLRENWNFRTESSPGNWQGRSLQDAGW